MTNTVNTNDFVLGAIWFGAQYCEKPNIKTSTSRSNAAKNCVNGGNFGQVDDADQQFWANLKNTDAGQELTWGDFCTTSGSCAHANLTRQWSELSYWFPSISFAEGAGGVGYKILSTPAPITSTVPTINFTQYAPPYNFQIDKLGTTHSYMALQPYSVVSPAWIQVRNSLCPAFPNCN